MVGRACSGGYQVCAAHEAGFPGADCACRQCSGNIQPMLMTGPIQNAVKGECPQGACTGICQAFGAVPSAAMLQASWSPALEATEQAVAGLRRA